MKPEFPIITLRKRNDPEARAFQIVVTSDRRSNWFAADGTKYPKWKYEMVDKSHA